MGGHQLLRMLQTVQAFGREKLDEAGLLQTVETRHGEVYAARCADLGHQFESVNEAKAANAIYSSAQQFPEKDRMELLKLSETLLRRALAAAGNRNEMSALCKFELANVLSFPEARPG